jgi:hypothetical protein
MEKWKIGAITGGVGILSLLLFKRFAPFSSSIQPIPEGMRSRMTGLSWNDFCPLSLDDLVLVKVRYRNNWGFSSVGKLIVNKNVAPSLVEAFRELYALGFPIDQIHPIDKFNADDPTSMRNNNTSSFRCSEREKAAHDRRGTWSEHAKGEAIDINPLVNPFVTSSGGVQPIEGKPYVDRDQHVKGMVTPEVIAIFKKHGWKWGGNWSSSKDYQHFSIGGR